MRAKFVKLHFFIRITRRYIERIDRIKKLGSVIIQFNISQFRQTNQIMGTGRKQLLVLQFLNTRMLLLVN